MMEAQTNNPEEEVAPAKAEIIVFFVGGTRMHAQTAHTADELEKILLEHHKIAVIKTENEDPNVLSEVLHVHTEQVQFSSIRTMKPASAIAAVPAIVSADGQEMRSRRRRD